MLSSPCVHWVFFNDELKIETIKRYLDTTLSQKCCKFTFRKGQMSKELLTEIMDKVPVTMALNIDSGIPLDFKHSNVSVSFFYCKEVVTFIRSIRHLSSENY